MKVRLDALPPAAAAAAAVPDDGITITVDEMSEVLATHFLESADMVKTAIKNYAEFRDTALRKSTVTDLTGGPVFSTCIDASRLPKVPHMMLLAGGGSRVRGLHAALAGLCPRTICTSNCGVSEDEAIAYGASLRGATHRGNTSLGQLIRTVPHSISVGLHGGVVSVLVPRGSTMPCESDWAELRNVKAGTYSTIPLLEGDDDKWSLGSIGSQRTGAGSRNLHVLSCNIQFGTEVDAGKAQMQVKCSIDGHGELTLRTKYMGNEVSPVKQGMSIEACNLLRARMLEEVRATEQPARARLLKAMGMQEGDMQNSSLLMLQKLVGWGSGERVGARSHVLPALTKWTKMRVFTYLECMRSLRRRPTWTLTSAVTWGPAAAGRRRARPPAVSGRRRARPQVSRTLLSTLWTAAFRSPGARPDGGGLAQPGARGNKISLLPVHPLVWIKGARLTRSAHV